MSDVRHGESVLWRIRDQPPSSRGRGTMARQEGGGLRSREQRGKGIQRTTDNQTTDYGLPLTKG